jgi:3-isopropylmalate/(R)-2-methylmalate dehydratase small subunit
LESKEAVKETRQNDILKVDLNRGEIRNVTKKKVYEVQPFPKFLQGIISSGGLLKYVR